ncbi:MAG: NAD(+)/NADH kinase [candidate division WOR-3 bacterium]|nr:NAD(+)/NADH kinase [candidate division WOR-3 bacterium]
MKIGIIANLKKKSAAKTITELLNHLKRKGLEPLLESGVADNLKIGHEGIAGSDLAKSAQLVIALGGDGTLLRAARLIGDKGIPIMGVNLGGLGFLTEFSCEELEEALDDFLCAKHREEQRMVLLVKLRKERFFALNDCSINMGPSCRVIETIIYTDSSYVTRFIADGVVIATPTGSTAYSLAAGGPIVFPTMEAILITPLCPHALAARPLVMPADETMTVELDKQSEPAILIVDGQERREFLPGEKVIFTKAAHKIRLVAPKNKSYYEILRSKMKWGGKPGENL